MHVRARKASGGVGILIRNEIVTNYKVRIIDRSVEGILGFEFVDKYTEYCFRIYACYLPPEGSPWANPTEFYGHLVSELSRGSECDNILLCGDFNARVGDMQDVINGLDDISDRKVIDKIRNSYGQDLIAFLNDSKMCITNGRFQPVNDNYTCISCRGQSVVDYILTPQECLNSISQFTVRVVNNIIEQHNLYTMLSTQCKATDHSVVTVDIACSYVNQHTNSYRPTCNMVNNTDTGQNVINSHARVRKYRLSEPPPDFMNNDVWRYAINELISHTEQCLQTQVEIDEVYEKICKTILGEMDRSGQYTEASSFSKKRHKNYKTYWNKCLTKMWNDMHRKEKNYRRYRGVANEKHRLKSVFIQSQKCFDQALRTAERKYNYDMLNHIDNLNVNNPRDFWKHIKHLGDRKSRIPLKVYKDCVLSSNEQIVTQTWHDDFKRLYNNNGNLVGDDAFYDNAIDHKCVLENMMSSPGYISNELINNPISFDGSS